MDAKICGIKDPKTLNYIISHNNPPKFIGFITNYPKSKRHLEYEDLKKLIDINKKKINFVSVLVNPNDKILEKIKNLNFDYYQLYDVSPEKTKIIKKKYKVKIITALTIENKYDVEKYKKFDSISEIILFDSKGYEKTIGFDHQLLNNVPASVNKMLAGNIRYDDKLDKYSKITDIIDISGSLETSGEKDISKIKIFLENISKIKNEN
jgi:phosphoribosylanthranilate isomerase|tara:strand:- start:48 stop:671 length:624 start_codon:yes stop_codon:yes gene_type:complete